MQTSSFLPTLHYMLILSPVVLELNMQEPRGDTKTKALQVQ